MAVSDWSGTTAGTTLKVLQKKVQGNLHRGFQAECEEWGWAKALKDLDINFSAREVTKAIDISNQPQGAFIPEGGYEANPITVAPQELTFTWANFNTRFSFTVTSKLIDKKNRNVQIQRQLKYQTIKQAEGMANGIGYAFYGFSTGVKCQTSTIATQASGAYTLKDAFGVTTIDNAAYIGGLFQVNDRVALIRSAALVANAIGVVTAVNTSTPSITVTWNGSVTSADNDQVVLANSVENTTIAGTDYNNSPVGLLDMATSTSVHSLSGTTYPNWTVALNDSSGGRFSAVRLMYARHLIRNKGGGDPDMLIVDQGVLRDMYSQERAALRYSDPRSLDMDGAIKAKGISIKDSRKVPPTYAFVVDAGKSLRKWAMVDMPSQESGAGVPDYGDESIDKREDRNQYAFSFDFPFQFVCLNRGNIALHSGLTTANA